MSKRSMAKRHRESLSRAKHKVRKLTAKWESKGRFVRDFSVDSWLADLDHRTKC